MIQQNSSKSTLYLLLGAFLLLIPLAVNPFTIEWWQAKGIWPGVHFRFMYDNDVNYLLPIELDVLLLGIGGIMLFSRRKIGAIFDQSPGFNLFIFSILLLIMFSLNVLHTGNFRWFRIGYMLLLLFFLAKTFYTGIVRPPENVKIRPWMRKTGLVIFGFVAIFLLLETGFMFVHRTHRFDGSLSSRAWFAKYWELNEVGFRDRPLSAADSGKVRILLLGDSFVAGHGIDDPSDRFGDRLEQLAGPDKYRVYNLGINGSDVHQALRNLQEYPLKPDILIYSYYQNDIENDGARSGLELIKAKSYHELNPVLRFFIRRSYTLNYLYWRMPHPEEIGDFDNYLKTCFQNPRVMEFHTQKLDSLKILADAAGAPLAIVNWPFLPDAGSRAYATEPINQFFRERGIPCLDVRAFILNRDAETLIVNNNDGHPSAALHHEVADSLYKLLLREKILE